MIEDEQTHTLPKSEEGLAHIACFMGYDERTPFAAALIAVAGDGAEAIMPGCSSAKPN